jgi:hypothetical protein
MKSKMLAAPQLVRHETSESDHLHSPLLRRYPPRQAKCDGFIDAQSGLPCKPFLIGGGLYWSVEINACWIGAAGVGGSG